MPVIHPDPHVEGILQGSRTPKDIKMVATGTGAPALLTRKRGDIAVLMSGDIAVAELENRIMETIEFRPSFFGYAVATREANRPLGLSRSALGKGRYRPGR